MGLSPVIEVEKWRETVNQASPAFAISRRTAARLRRRMGVIRQDERQGS